MPIYEIQCTACGAKDEIHSHKVIDGDKGLPACVKCTKPTTKLISRPRRDTWPENGVTLDHVAENPVHFNSRKELKSYLRDRKLASPAWS